MNLHGTSVVIVALTSAVACHDATSPSPPTPERVYVLESVSGAPLPANLGGSTTVVWSTLSLSDAGAATTVDHIKSEFQNVSSENTYVRHQQYKVFGDSIEIGSFTPCPPGADCIGNTKGTISDSNVSLTIGYNPYPTNPIVYLYRLVS